METALGNVVGRAEGRWSTSLADIVRQRVPAARLTVYDCATDGATVTIARPWLPPLLGWRPFHPTTDEVLMGCPLRSQELIAGLGGWVNGLAPLFGEFQRMGADTSHRMTAEPLRRGSTDWRLGIWHDSGQWQFVSRTELVFHESGVDGPVAAMHRQVAHLLDLDILIQFVERGDRMDLVSNSARVIGSQGQVPRAMPSGFAVNCDSVKEALALHQRVVESLGLSQTCGSAFVLMSRESYNSARTLLERASREWRCEFAGVMEGFSVDQPPPRWPRGEPVWRPRFQWLATKGTSTRDETIITCAEVKDAAGVYLEFCTNGGSFAELQKHVRSVFGFQLTQLYPMQA